MTRHVACALRLVVIFFLSGSAPIFGMPQFLQMFRSDPFRNPAFDGCNTCHMSPEGGDARNTFGQAFENAGERITTLLRAQFPDRFIYPVSKVSETLTIHFSDPNNKQIVVETGGMKHLVDVERKTVNDTPAALASGPAPGPTAVPATQAAERQSAIPVDPYAREGAFFGSNLVNLPDGKPMRAGSWEFFVGHRFYQDIKAEGLAGLFGFDSVATVAYGVRAGITDRLNVGVLRTNDFRTISLNSAFQISRQGASSPVTLQLRGGVDGKQNFGLYSKDNNPAPRQYSPFIQLVTTRTFRDRVSFTAIPIFAFNSRDETQVSLVGEYIPRLWGYRGEGTDYNSVSIGLQKSTFRHTFTLVFARQLVLTPVAAAYQGHDKFHIGFNIYRKLR